MDLRADPNDATAFFVNRNFPLRRSERRLFKPYGLERPQYVEDRVPSAQTCFEAGLGTLAADGFSDRVAIPITNVEGLLVGFAGRRFDDVERADRYIYWPGRFEKSLELYNLHRHAEHCRRVPCDPQTIIVVPGFFDVYHFSGTTLPLTVATMGYQLSVSQTALLKKFARTVIVACPATPDGERLAESCRARLGHDISVSVRMFGPFHIEGARPGRWLERFLLG